MLRALQKFLWTEDPQLKLYQRQGVRVSGRGRKLFRPTEKPSPPLLHLPHPIEPVKRSSSLDEAFAPETPASVVPLDKRRPLIIEDPATQKLLASNDIKLPALRNNRSSGKKIFTGPLRNQILRAQARNRRSMPSHRVALKLRYPSSDTVKTHQLFDAFLSSDTPASDESEVTSSEEDDLSWVPSEYLAVRHILEKPQVVPGIHLTSEEQPSPHFPSVIIFDSNGPSHPRPLDFDSSDPAKSMGWLFCQRLKKLQDEAKRARATIAEREEAERIRIETSMAVRAIQMDWDDMQKKIFRPFNPEAVATALRRRTYGTVTEERSFYVHEKKWSHLLDTLPTPFDKKALPARYFPWPVLSPGPMGPRCTAPLTHPDSPENDITMARILEFIFHPARINALSMLDPRRNASLKAKTLVLIELRKWCKCQCEVRKRVLSRVPSEDRERLEKGWKVVREMLIQILAYFDDAPDSDV